MRSGVAPLRCLRASTGWVKAYHRGVSDALQRAREHAHDARFVIDDEDVGVSVSEVTHCGKPVPYPLSKILGGERFLQIVRSFL